MSLPKQILMIVLSIGLGACVTRFDTPQASGRYVASPMQCVPYARSATGIQLRGDAHTWWPQAVNQGRPTGRYPAPGSVMVFSRTSSMTHGHLAAVKDILDRRHINVTHSNWGDDWRSRRIIYESMRVEDISANNDWSLVRLWNKEIKNYGFPYRVDGFIYR